MGEEHPVPSGAEAAGVDLVQEGGTLGDNDGPIPGSELRIP